MQHETGQMRAEDPVPKIHACSTNWSAKKQKQTVHPAVPNIDTVVDASLTVCQIDMEQGSTHFWRGPHKLLHNSSNTGHLS